MRDRVFQNANQVFSGYMTKLREEGKDINQPKETIVPEDVKKLYSKVFTNTPQGLQSRIFFKICLHFGRWGREGLRELACETYEFAKDPKGIVYLLMKYHEREKCKQGNEPKTKEKDPYMFEIPGSPDCLIKHYKDFLKHLSPECEALFQRPKKMYK